MNSGGQRTRDRNATGRSIMRMLLTAALAAIIGMFTLAIAAPASAMQTTEGDGDVVIELIPATSSSIAPAPEEEADGEINVGGAEGSVSVSLTSSDEAAPVRYASNRAENADKPADVQQPGAVTADVEPEGNSAGVMMLVVIVAALGVGAVTMVMVRKRRAH